MGRNRSFVNDHKSEDLELYVEKYSLQVQYTKDDHIR